MGNACISRQVKLIIDQILVGKYKSREHLGEEDYIKRQCNERFCACLD